MVLIETALQLHIMPKPPQNLWFLYFFAYSSDIPHHSLSEEHTTYTIIIFGVGHPMDLALHFDFMFREPVSQNISYFLYKILAFIWQFIRFDVVSDNHLGWRGEFC